MPGSDQEANAHQGLLSPPPVSSPETSSCPCRSTASGSGNPRNLIVCIDGTSNKFGVKNTNIIELYSQIKKSDQQLTYYNSGIGTYARPSWRSFSYWKQLVDNKIDLAIAWNLETVIMAAYRWLADNYHEGDKIFMFGFSRGAYQARAVAGMIAKVGLLLPGNNEQIPFAFELYACLNDRKRRKSNEDDERAKVFKRTFCRPDVSIHFVGAWDTVSSVGPFRGRTLPFTTSSQHICMFRHALALDERRVKFLPEYVYGGNSETGASSNSSDSNRVKEVWFPGTHSDVCMGGISLLWMKKEAESAGLEFVASANNNLAWLKDIERPPTESLTFVWWLLEALPIKRLSYNAGKSEYARGCVLV
ncbi:hypothetical protein CONPUDRAFT_62877 [Coniophora puteana RWD-64-598 SS2]|uniref:T6SS Phospholipase effector Tle1-like catalytic domain-containing protein n=1 Tax=Coniophora puteana (strain RWD-64-598) TaxID=741705 RepID=A0A5M3MEM6_CONPW|nr:uncharacterized protein CONPUDRAFT_62877 [Coniophora puteana RWD-64-598 SS2]EIW77370.1 hypothetical protein CONPUDRAFT_62877 [Coniophora puteana RWD-64-598 SS2]